MNNEFVLGQYRIGKSIGEGTFGKVRLATHIPTNQKVAVKTLQKQKIVEQADIQRVTRQICILKILRHPNVIQLYEIIQTKTDIHLIMEYAEGGELFDHIVKKKRLDQKQAISFMQQILSGVEYIHKNGIVHRDLKPQNLLLDHNGNIKIVDFGLSNQYKPGQRLKTACGSPCYAAPQMIAGKRYQCLGADIWSCGIILYAMLCGYLPFQDPNTSKLYKKIMAGQYETPRILTQDSKDILKGILNVNPDKRFNIKDIRQSKWYSLLGKNYAPLGIVVGKDVIQVDERVLKKMSKYGVEANQAKTFVENNRHNQATALYYLLKVKGERDPSFLAEEPKSKQRRQQSPIIYRPDSAKPAYYMPTKPRRQQRQNRQNSRNDSLNVSNIISSLVEANKGKLVNGGMRFGAAKRQNNFDKLEQFKLFPNKKNSSIYEPRVKTEDRSYEVSKQKAMERQKEREKERKQKQRLEKQKMERTDRSEPKSYQVHQSAQKAEEGLNKKRQQLSEQLKQISFKIDQEINQLRKQNVTPTNSTSVKKRQSVPSSAVSTSRNKAQDNNSSMVKSMHKQVMTPRETLNSSRDGGLSSRGGVREHRQPKIHTGPFNTQCIFMEPPRTLLEKITNTLLKMNMRYTEPQAFALMSGGMHLSIQSVQGINGLHLVKFQGQHPLNTTILQVLSK